MANSVQNNISAINANRNFGITKGTLKSSTEKLSSGFKINRAADDAAGLAISEKMRRQIRGLTQASANAQDGISSVQTAEGALTEVHAMLQRMDELATKASNGSNSESDRQFVQDELDQLMTEIDRVSETTKFNETYLLKGKADKSETTKNITAKDAGIAGTLTNNGDGTASFKLDKELKNGEKINIAGTEYKIGKTNEDSDFVTKTDAAAKTVSAGDSATHNGATVTAVNEVGLSAAKGLVWAANDTFTDSNGVKWTVVADTATTEDKGDGTGTVRVSDVGTKLDVGSTITKNAGKKIGSAAADDYKAQTVVKKIDANKYSFVEKGKKEGAATVNDLIGAPVEGDTISVGGVKQTVTDEEADSFNDIKDAIMKLEADNAKTVKINADTYTVSTTTDVASKKYTREDIIAMIEEFDEVTVDTADIKTVYGVDNTTHGDTITIEDARRKIADELTVASSIGTDEGKGAEVTVKNDGTFDIKEGTVTVKNALEFNLHVGADADMTNKIGVKIEAMDTKGLGIKGLNVVDDNGIKATYALDSIEEAIKIVSQQRSALGAAQNRLEHTIKNVDNVVENTTSAESAIRDTDMATEMVKFSNANILAQAGQSMLAQANQQNQGILSLLG